MIDAVGYPGVRRCEGQENISIGGVLHGPRHNPDDGIGPSVELNFAACHVGVGPKVPLPERVAENGDVVFAGLGLRRSKGTADEGLNAHHIEEIR